VGVLLQKFSAAKLIIGSEKVLGVQKWHGPPLSLWQVWWGSCVARRCRQKSVFFCLSRFGITKIM